jgi:hypothetical protein
MISYHNRGDLKTKLVTGLSGHIGALIPAVQESAELLQPLMAWDDVYYATGNLGIQTFSSRFGIPIWLVEVWLYVAELLPVQPSRLWVCGFMQSIAVGSQLENAKYSFFSDLLVHPIIGMQEAASKEAQVELIVTKLAAIFRKAAGTGIQSETSQELQILDAQASDLEEQLRSRGHSNFVVLQRVLYSIDWLIMEKVLNAFLFAMASHMQNLDPYTAKRITNREGSQAVVAAGIAGYYRRSERDAFLFHFALWMTGWVGRSN